MAGEAYPIEIRDAFFDMSDGYEPTRDCHLPRVLPAPPLLPEQVRLFELYGVAGLTVVEEAFEGRDPEEIDRSGTASNLIGIMDSSLPAEFSRRAKEAAMTGGAKLPPKPSGGPQ